MFIDIMCAIIALVGSVNSSVNGQKTEAMFWFVLGIYAVLNFSDRRLKGSKYDY